MFVILNWLNYAENNCPNSPEKEDDIFWYINLIKNLHKFQNLYEHNDHLHYSFQEMNINYFKEFLYQDMKDIQSRLLKLHTQR